MESIASGPRLIVIGGCPRSGTTFAQLVLHATGQVNTTNETHLFSQFVGPAMRRYAAMSANSFMGRRNVGLHLLLGPEEFLAGVRGIVDNLLLRIADPKEHRPFICEKTPENLLWWREIVQLVPDAIFVNVVRDPRSVVASTVASAKSWAGEWAGGSIEQIATRWNQFVSIADEMEASGAEPVTLRYERLLASDVGYTARKLKKIGIEVPNETVRQAFASLHISRLKAPLEGSRFPWPVANEPPGFFRSGLRDSWRTELSPRDIELVNRVCAAGIKKYGYDKGEGTES